MITTTSTATMPMRIESLINVPDDKLSYIIKSFYRDGAVHVVSEPMPDGAWTVTATFAATTTTTTTATG